MRMRASWMLGIVVAGAVGSVGAGRAQAQAAGVDSTPYVRAREMVANGETEAGRHLVDSLLKAATPGSAEYAEGLYWRAAIAASGRDAERDYRQIVVDYPTSPRVAPALLRMGQLEAARGDREASMQHFQRLVIEHPESPLRAEASYWVANAYLAKNDLQHGCTANADALEYVGANVELKNRIDYQQLRCRNVRLAGAPATAEPAAAPVITAPPKPVAKTIGKPAKKSTEKAAPVTKESTAVTREVPVERPVASAESTATAPVRDTALAAVEAPVTEKPVTEKPVTEKPAAAESATVLPSVTKATKTTKSATKTATKTATRATTNRAMKTATKTAAKTAARATTRAEAAEAPTASAESTSASNERGYAVQVAAYKSRAQADSLAAKLRARGYPSHVDGDGAPYRVRIGHYARRADAVSELRRLKAKKIDGFVTEP